MSAELWPLGAALRPQQWTGTITGGEIETVPYTYLRFTAADGVYEHSAIDLGEIKTGALMIATSADGPIVIETRHKLDAPDAWTGWALHTPAAIIARHVQVRLRPVGAPRVVHWLAINHVSAV